MSICSLIGTPETISVTSPIKNPSMAMRPFTFSAYGVNPCGPRYSLSILAFWFSASRVKTSSVFPGLFFVSSAIFATEKDAGRAESRVEEDEVMKEEVARGASGVTKAEFIFEGVWWMRASSVWEKQER